MKKLISFVISLILVVMIIPVANIEVNASNSGNFGENIIWVYDYDTKTLTISGEGDIPEYNAYQSFDGNYIETIVITDGVTSISSYFFGSCESATSISIPTSITKINKQAFEYCSSLRNVYYAGTEAQWDKISISSEGNIYLLNAKINYKEEPHICSFGEWNIVIEPTCVDEGSKIRNCRCGNKEIETIPATGIHNFEWKTSIKASCTENGEEKQHCSVCKAIGETRTINKQGHKTGEWEVVDKATCVKNGLKVKKCDNCGEVLEETEIEKLGHNFGAWKTTIKETEKQDGQESRTCKSCKYTETRLIDNIQSSDNNIIGDANDDGKVTAKDARLVLQVVAGLKDNKDLIFTNADVNKDNRITAADARLILQIVAGIK